MKFAGEIITTTNRLNNNNNNNNAICIAQIRRNQQMGCNDYTVGENGTETMGQDTREHSNRSQSVLRRCQTGADA